MKSQGKSQITNLKKKFLACSNLHLDPMPFVTSVLVVSWLTTAWLLEVSQKILNLESPSVDMETVVCLNAHENSDGKCTFVPKGFIVEKTMDGLRSCVYS